MGSLVAERSVLVSGPAGEPITTAQAKAHLRVTNSAEDAYIDWMISAARQRIEKYTDRIYRTQTWRTFLDRWPADDRLRLPKGPLLTVVSVKHKDTAGSETLWTAAGNYIVDTNPVPGEVVLAYQAAWPQATLYPASPITVEYTAGYGANAADVDEEYLAPLYWLVGHMNTVRDLGDDRPGDEGLPTLRTVLDNFVVSWF